jgi:hypothetical protein
MTAPATPASGPSPAKPAPTHACARCGAPVALDVGLCERCNPLGLKDAASSQVHGTVFLGIGVAIVGMAIVAHLLVGGIGPFTAQVTAIRPSETPGSVFATLQVRNDGRTAGSATCRLIDPTDPAILHSLVVYSPRIEPGATAAWEQEVDFGAPNGPLRIECRGP